MVEEQETTEDKVEAVLPQDWEWEEHIEYGMTEEIQEEDKSEEEEEEEQESEVIDEPRDEQEDGEAGGRDEVKKMEKEEKVREITMKRIWSWQRAHKEERNDLAQGKE